MIWLPIPSLLLYALAWVAGICLCVAPRRALGKHLPRDCPIPPRKMGPHLVKFARLILCSGGYLLLDLRLPPRRMPRPRGRMPSRPREVDMDEIKAFFQRDPFARHLGIELTQVSPGRAKATMPIRDQHANALGGLHGGAIFGLADFVFSAASNSHGSLSVAINVSISYLRPPDGALLHAEAVEVSRSRRLGSYTVRITDDHQHLVALFQGMVYVKGDPLPFAPSGPAEGGS